MPTIMSGMPAAAPAATSVEPIAGSDADAAAPTPRHATPRPPRPSPRNWRRLSALIDGIPELLGPKDGDLGSNSWVVSGELTESGIPLLANDPHLGPAMPSIWDADGAALRRAARRLRVRRQPASPSPGFRA